MPLSGPPDAGPDEPRRPLTAFASLSGLLRGLRLGAPDDDARLAMDELVPADQGFGDFLVRFGALTILSSAIAAFGLLADSGAVVIGAMLVAPLMTPIMAAAYATVVAHDGRLVRALAVIALGTGLAIAVGWLVSLIGGGALDPDALPTEIQSRTYPGLLDLGIAVSAGAAAGYVQPRRAALSALPGVGIAVALVPPLATVGITAQIGQGHDAWNAFLLFLTNLAAIVFSAGVVLALSGFRPRPEAGRRVLRARLAVTLGAVVAVAIPLTVHTRTALAEQSLKSAVSDAVEAWDPDARVIELGARQSDGVADVELVLSGRSEAPSMRALADEIRERHGGPVQLTVRYHQDRILSVSAR